MSACIATIGIIFDDSRDVVNAVVDKIPDGLEKLLLVFLDTLLLLQGEER
jgi:hypothetical protein